MLLNASGIHLIPDWTVLAQLCIFLVALVAINSFIIKPVLRSMALRRAYTDGAEKEASRLEDDASKLDDLRREALKKEIAEAQRVKTESIETAEIAAASMLRLAREDIKKVLESSSSSIASTTHSIFDELEMRADEISAEVIAKFSKNHTQVSEDVK